MLIFTDDCLTGIEEIDNEHKKLFKLINDAYVDLNDKTIDKQIACIELLRNLKNYASTHFEHEEAYMKQINAPELPHQQKAHEAFKAKINNIHLTGLSDENLTKTASDLLDYMSRWLFSHVISSDTLIGKTKTPFTFTDDYLVGVDFIDNEHRRLFEIMSQANNLINDETLFDKYDPIIEIIEELREYTEFHFADEERFMLKIGYPNLDKQEVAHALFVSRLNEIDLDNIDDNQDDYLNDLLSFLLNWLSNHIKRMDKKIGEYYLTNHKNK